MKIEPKYKIGDKVWLAFTEEGGGDKYMRLFGPLTINRVRVTGDQKLGNQPVIEVVYYFNAFSGEYREWAVHTSLEEAISYCHNKLHPPEAKPAAA